MPSTRTPGIRIDRTGALIIDKEHRGTPIYVRLGLTALEPSLSTDVETNMTADFFTQMRSAMTMQRMVINQAVLDTNDTVTFPAGTWPPFPAGLPPLLNARDVLRFATINGANDLRLDSKTGSLKVGKEADIIILDGSHLNVFPRTTCRARW